MRFPRCMPNLRLATLWLAGALLFAPRAARGQTAGNEPFAFDAARDGAWLGGALVLWAAPMLIGSELPGPACDPCDPAGLNALDRRAVGQRSAAADGAGDVLVAALPIGAAALGTLHLTEYGWRGVGIDAWLILQSIATCGVVNQLVRHAVRRPRPFMYAAGIGDAATRGDVEATLSFYSGHAATAFAAVTAFSYIYFFRKPEHWTRWIVLAGALLAASAVPVTRVLSGEHFPSDVLVGAAVGSAFGVLVPALHRNRRRDLQLSSVIGPAVGLQIGGRF